MSNSGCFGGVGWMDIGYVSLSGGYWIGPGWWMLDNMFGPGWWVLDMLGWVVDIGYIGLSVWYWIYCVEWWISVLLLTFQIFQIFQEMKYFFLCFSTSWKMVFYGIQIFEKLFSMLFRFWKENFYAFHLLEKVILWFSVYTLGS